MQNKCEHTPSLTDNMRKRGADDGGEDELRQPLRIHIHFQFITMRISIPKQKVVFNQDDQTFWSKSMFSLSVYNIIIII